MRQYIRSLAVCVFTLLLGVADAWSAGGLIKKPDLINYTFYLYPKTDVSDEQIAHLLATAAIRFPDFKIVSTITDLTPAPSVLIQRLRPGDQFYLTPSFNDQWLRSHGIEDNDKAIFDGRHETIALYFGYRSEDAVEKYRDIVLFANEATAYLGSYIFDQESDELFTPTKWQSRRVDSWDGKLPAASMHFQNLTYPSGEFYRTATIGLLKFGLPDIVIDDVKPGDGEAAGNLINAVASLLVQGQSPASDGRLQVSLDAIAHSGLREYLTGLAFDNAKRSTAVWLRPAARLEEDDGRARVAITFGSTSGDGFKAQVQAFDELFGWEDKLYQVKHEGELMAASERAKGRIRELSKTYARILEEGHTLLIKGPFGTDEGGTEWMWIAVTEWKDGTITGVLVNKLYNINHLAEGAIVSFAEADAFDYLLRRTDGTEEGNETSAIIQKLSAGQSE